MLNIAVPCRETVYASYRTGSGYCPGHFGELLQRAFSCGDSIVRGLITLPCSMVGSKAEVTVTKGSGRIHAEAGKRKVARLADAYMIHHQVMSAINIRVAIHSTIPMGIGMGSSTSDIVATIRALDAAFGIKTEPQDFANLALCAELASDSTMHADRMMIFSQRSGEILEDYGIPYPRFLVQGFALDPGETFDTDATRPPRYEADEIAFFDDARVRLRAVARDRDLTSLAAIASQSATINQQYHPQRRFAELVALSVDSGALGYCLAHSGTVGGLILPASMAEAWGQLKRIDCAALDAGMELIGSFVV